LFKKLLILSLGLVLVLAGMLPADIKNPARDGKIQEFLTAGKADLSIGTPLLTEGFEGGALPVGWSVVQTNTDNSQTLPGYWTVNTHDFNSGAYSAGLWFAWFIDDIEVGYEGGDSCFWQPGDDHKMHYPQLPDETGWAVNATQPLVLADDFRCMQTGLIKDVHWWGAWMQGIEGEVLSFVLSLRADIPADPPSIPYSRPGITLWEVEIPGMPGTPVDPSTMEGWYDPAQGLIIPDDHQAYFQYDVCLDEQYWFHQDSNTIYWLNITAIVEDPGATQWGWKSTQDHWNDDAVYAFWGNLDWQELYVPASADTIFNAFFVEFDEGGMLVAGDGENAYGDGWYHYPMYDWWNIWFYDHPFAPERHKTGLIDFDIFPRGPGPSYAEIAVNWSTDIWSLDQPPNDNAPPLPGVDEDLYIGREVLFVMQDPEGHFVFPFEILDYNPEWVSIDVRGFNFIVPGGVIMHSCESDQVSLDLAFVVTGGLPPLDSGACCFEDGSCTDTDEDDCVAVQGGTWMGAGMVCQGDLAPANGIDDDCESISTSVPDYESGLIPTEYSISQNYPNPFNPMTTIEFAIPRSEFVTLKIFNVLGNRITTLISRRLSAGYWSVSWDGSNAASGMYFYKITAGEFTVSKKMIMLK